MKKQQMKKLFDIVMALLMLVMMSPLLLVVALLVWINLGSPVFFRQQRPGYQGRPFMMMKFRTMLDVTGPGGETVPDHERLTRFGSMLRKSSADELPELWNVIRGEMSLVGPRPLLMEYLPLYDTEQTRRHEVKPGITGWAQINGRNTISWKQKFEYDVWYVDNHSFLLDLKILWMTLIKVFCSEGVAQSGHVTMEKFRGNK